MSESVLDLLGSFGMVNTAKPYIGYKAAIPTERAKARINAWQNRAYGLRVLAKDRLHWFVEIGVEFLYFDDGSIHMSAPYIPDLSGGIAFAPYSTAKIEWLLNGVVKQYQKIDSVSPYNPVSEFTIEPEMFVSRHNTECPWNTDLSQTKGADCMFHPALEVFQMTPEELKHTAEMLGVENV